MKHRIANEYSYITSVKAMRHAVLHLWEEFGDHRWDHLIESMPERIQAVIKAKGDSTSY